MPSFRASFESPGVPTRRQCLALGLGALLAARGSSSDAKRTARAKTVLVVFTPGGMSQHETWDPKPNAPEEIRGEFGTIATAVPGLRFGEHLPNVAKIADKFTVLKSLTHDDTDHGSACYLSLTGQFHPKKSSNPRPSPDDYPTLGSLVQKMQPSKLLPKSAVHLNGPILLPELTGPGNGGGFLGRAHDPFVVGDPTDSARLFESMAIRDDLTDERRGLLTELDGKSSLATEHIASVKAAYDLLEAKRFREAFDLTQEPKKVHEAYGTHRSGQTLLLARRLVEAGVPWITAFFNHGIRGQDKKPDDTDAYGWDTHNDIFDSLKTHLLPRFDRSFAALLNDLDERGLLKDTLVVCLGEFGRAPLVAVEKRFAGSSPGRKHWAGCYSAVLAGAGIPRGGVYGASDRHAAYPQSQPVSPGDLVATLFDALGMDPASHYRDSADRPYRLSTGEPIAKLFGSS